MITYIKGDLLSVKTGIIAHGCNAQGVMGSGVAKAVRAKYPDAYSSYRTFCKNEEDKSRLVGRTSWYNPNHKLFIANCITQNFFGGDGALYVDYEGLAECMLHLNYVNAGLSIHMPKIGCGLGGGDWNVVSKIIEDKIKSVPVFVYEL